MCVQQHQKKGGAPDSSIRAIHPGRFTPQDTQDVVAGVSLPGEPGTTSSLARGTIPPAGPEASPQPYRPLETRERDHGFRRGRQRGS